MKNSKKQIALLLGVLVIPAFLFLFFQNSFKNYYKLPIFGQVKPNKAITTFDKTLSVLFYPTSQQDTLQSLIFTNVRRMAENKDLQTLLAQKLPDFKSNYYFVANGKSFASTQNLQVLSPTPEIQSYFKTANINAILLDNQGNIRGQFALLKGAYLDNDEMERLLTELKVLIEIVASQRQK